MAKQSYHRWTREEEAWLKEHWACMYNPDIAEHLGVTVHAAKKKAREFGLQKSPEWLSYICRFPNGGMYQKGKDPLNTLVDHAITVRTNKKTGAISKWIRIGKNQWQQLSHYNWLQAGRQIQEGYVLRFIDGNPANCDVSNLESVPRGQHLSMNRRNGKPREKRSTVRGGLDKQQRSERLAALQQASLERRNVKKQLTAERHRIKREAIREQRRQERAALKAQKEWQARQAKEQRKRERQKQKVEARWAQQSQENKKRVKVFQIVKRDFSGLIPVRIDARTTIYAKPGQDPEEVRRKYLKNREGQKVA